MKMENRTFDFLKRLCEIGLPALETLWLTLGAIWGFPCYEAVGATIAAVTVFLGAILKISTDRYYNDKLVCEDEEECGEECERPRFVGTKGDLAEKEAERDGGEGK